jgi:phosphoglycerate kinase
MKTIANLNFANKRALVRVDFNVPLDENFKITDLTRISAAIPTLKKILNDGGSIVLMSHLGRPKDGPEDKFSLRHIVSAISELLGVEVLFAKDCIDAEAFSKSASLKNGEVLLLENLRFYKEEEKGDKGFAEKLSKHGEIYVNDAFGTAHRAHASTAVIANYFTKENKCFGYVMEGEIASIDKVLNEAQKPFTAIIGGAKVSDKILIIEQLMAKADNILIGGGMAYTFVKAMGGKIGKSLCEDDRLETALELIEKAKEKGVKLCIPSDAVIADAFSNEANKKEVNIKDIPDGWMGLDNGPETNAVFGDIIKKSKTILWNGPMGVFEMDAFANGTKTIAEAVAEATNHGAFSLIGGGDSAAAVYKFGFENQVSYVSTGGGALLEYFEGKELPGIAAINA